MKRSRLRRVSPAKAAWNHKYYAALKLAIAADPFCRRCRTALATEGHHQKGQAAAKIMDFVPLCRECHSGIELNKNQARKEGWITYK